MTIDAHDVKSDSLAGPALRPGAHVLITGSTGLIGRALLDRTGPLGLGRIWRLTRRPATPHGATTAA